MVTVAADAIALQQSRPPLRLLTATSIFDGHDAAIHIIRRLLQAEGAEVIHLGHSRGVAEIVAAALQEDVQGIAISSYQGGHMEYFCHLVESLKGWHAANIRVFGGGGGTITPQEAAALEVFGVEKVYLPEDGRRLGLQGMARDLMERTRREAVDYSLPEQLSRTDVRAIGRALSLIENGAELVRQLRMRAGETLQACPVIGITGTGGSGKSTLIDELLNRFLQRFSDLHIAMIAIDPTRQRTGGALLGDRIRMNSTDDPRVFMRSMATRRPHLATSAVLADCLGVLKTVGFGLVVVETAGTGQADTEIADLADLSVYVMTADYGAPMQLEKIQMLDRADLVVLNKFDKTLAEDALRDIRKQWRRNRGAFSVSEEEVPVYPTVASRFDDAGVDHLFDALCARLRTLPGRERVFGEVAAETGSVDTLPAAPIIPPARIRYLGEIAEHGRRERTAIEQQVKAASAAQAYYRSLAALGDPDLPPPLISPSSWMAEGWAEGETKLRLGTPSPSPSPPKGGEEINAAALKELRQRYHEALDALLEEARTLLREWPRRREQLKAKHYHYRVRSAEVTGASYTESLSQLPIPKVAAPRFEDWGELLRFLMLENLPGSYPYTAGVYPYRREFEEPTRMFAGEGGPERTNRRFHYLARGQKSIRLSTAFDPVALYGADPDGRPDMYGCLGMSGVSVATLDDMKKLYSGFDLCHPHTSVSMTINGPAPVMLAWFMHTAIDQQLEKYLRAAGKWQEAETRIDTFQRDRPRPVYRGELPQGHDGLGLGLLGVSGRDLIDCDTYERIRADTLASVRGTVQADILKEDQAQNECIFAVEFALRMMGDVQEYFIKNRVRNYYSVSVSGYHMAEAGANPITQLAFTLANGFTLVEYYLARGMAIDDFAPSFSFFFSNAMDPEYAVIGRVARRIWARAMRHLYRASARSQMLKYHCQTSGRSLHARTVTFNDIRTTLEALYAALDNCNSLHTNAFDEAVTTPTEESVRRALAIQLILHREYGVNLSQNVLQGSYFIEELTDLVEEAVYREFERLSERGGVLGAMESFYQRSRIQEESLYEETLKHDGRLPVIGVNTFVSPQEPEGTSVPAQLTRAGDEERQARLDDVVRFKRSHAEQAAPALKRLQDNVRRDGNVFEALMEAAATCCKLGQITHALYEVGGRYRRRM
ncbi:MAG: methylmalonyl-CoA mutase family protein [Chromatiales bacterium]